MKRALLILAVIASVLFLSGTAAWLYVDNRFNSGAANLKAGIFPAALDELRPLAEFGHSRSQHLLGQMYAFGWGVEKSPTQANVWLARATRWPSPVSQPIGTLQYFVARDFIQGTGVQVDLIEGENWLRRAAENGNEDAKVALRKAK